MSLTKAGETNRTLQRCIASSKNTRRTGKSGDLPGAGDRARPAFTPTAGQATALKAIQSQIGEYVGRNGTKFSFATHFDSDRGQTGVMDRVRRMLGLKPAKDTQPSPLNQ